MIIPRHSVGTPPDEDGVTVQAEGALEGQGKEPKAEGESSACEHPSLVLGVQGYHELRERVQVRNVHQNPRKLLVQMTREERSIRRFRRGQVGYVEDDDEVIDRELDDVGIGDGVFLAAW